MRSEEEIDAEVREQGLLFSLIQVDLIHSTISKDSRPDLLSLLGVEYRRNMHVVYPIGREHRMFGNEEGAGPLRAGGFEDAEAAARARARYQHYIRLGCHIPFSSHSRPRNVIVFDFALDGLAYQSPPNSLFFPDSRQYGLFSIKYQSHDLRILSQSILSTQSYCPKFSRHMAPILSRKISRDYSVAIG